MIVGKYNPYQKYRTSNLEWLDYVPSTWSNARMDDIALTIKEQVTPIDIAVIQVMHYSIPTIQMIGTGQAEDGSTIDSNKFRVKEGDVLFSKLNPRKQTITTVRSHDQPVVASTEFIVLRLTHSARRFVQYLLYSQELKSFVCSQVESATKSHQRINPSVISKLKFALPSEDECAVIANFLDHETAKIDTLIEKQQQLIKLLKEKRQAVISHAVTKGLNPNAPMCDSGVEWLGEVPEHWVVMRLKNTSDVIDCRNKTPEYFDDGEYFVVRTTNIKNQLLNMNGALYTDEANFKTWTLRGAPPAGSIFFTREAPAGEICIVPANLKLCMGQRMMNFVCHNHDYTSYLFDFLLSDCLERYIESVSLGSTVSHLRVEQVENIPVIVPPQNEARAIHEELAEIKTKYLKLTEEAESAIELMQERRTALISAAVTGKIDVRNWQAPKPSSTNNKEDAA